MNPEFWRAKKVFITGHTGFKGSWLSLWLQTLGADVAGYSLAPPTQPNLFDLAAVKRGMQSIPGDTLDLEHLRRAVQEQKPEIVFHLAAQSLVRRSYEDPSGTYAANVLGTANLLDALRYVPSVRSVVIVTTDKCYENRGDNRAYREADRLGGADPYSSSKAAAEIVTAAFRKSFFTPSTGKITVGIASARAGNVIGGGDWAADRLIPDAMRAISDQRKLLVRSPSSVRPWQHVLEPLFGYLVLAEKLWQQPVQFSEAWNFGPDESEAHSVSELLETLANLWGLGFSWEVDNGDHPHEAMYLRLDCAKANHELGWEPRWNLKAALEATVQWYKAHQSHQDLRRATEEQICSYQKIQNMPLIAR